MRRTLHGKGIEKSGAANSETLDLGLDNLVAENSYVVVVTVKPDESHQH